jgi:type VI protein secretion system component VasF
VDAQDSNSSDTESTVSSYSTAACQPRQYDDTYIEQKLSAAAKLLNMQSQLIRVMHSMLSPEQKQQVAHRIVDGIQQLESVNQMDW